MIADPLDALLPVVGILEDLGLPYAIGGSVASSIYGEPRASADADLIVELSDQQLPSLLRRLEGGSSETRVRVPHGRASVRMRAWFRQAAALRSD